MNSKGVVSKRLSSAIFALAAVFALGISRAEDRPSRLPQLLKRTPIAYPQSELANAREGFVSVIAMVREDGTVGDTRVERSSKVPAFDAAALDGVKRWTFLPALDAAGKPTLWNYSAVVDFSPGDAIEWRRLAGVYNAYYHAMQLNEEIFTRCDALGIDSKSARAAVRPDADTLARVGRLTAQLLKELGAAGNPDPEASAKQVRASIESRTRSNVEDMFTKWGKPEAQTHCRETLASAREQGFFYPGSDDLLEF
jgi:TonB family protein